MPTETEIAAQAARFMTMLDDAFRRSGEPNGLPPRLREAVLATPRHRFVHRFRIGDGPLADFGAEPDRLLPDVYSDQVMRHVSDAGEPLPSSNSQPSFVLWLLHMLDLEPGQAALEIGSGSGWLAAVMARLVGPAGKVVGIELLPDLARQSRMDLLDLGVENVNIIAADGAQGHVAGAPYDRAMITAGVWDLPAVLFDQVSDGGKVLAPIELRDGSGCEVTVFRRQGTAMVAQKSIPGWFVPLLGPGQAHGAARRSLDGLPFWTEISAQPTVICNLPLGTRQYDGPAPIAVQFRAFLGRTEPNMVVAPDADARRSPTSGQPVLPFGIANEADCSVALWEAGKLIGYGGRVASVRLARAYARWAELGLPGVGAFELRVHRTADAPASNGQRWVEQRSDTALDWRIAPGAANWQDLAGSNDELA